MGSKECLVISETPQICAVKSMLVWLSPTEALLIFIQSIWQGLGSITWIWTLALAFDESWQCLMWGLTILVKNNSYLCLPTAREIRRRLRTDLNLKHCCRERLFILSSFLTLTLFEFWIPICKTVNFPNFQKAQNASHQSFTNVKCGPVSILWPQKPLRPALSTQCWSNWHRLRLCWFLDSHFVKVLA